MGFFEKVKNFSDSIKSSGIKRISLAIVVVLLVSFVLIIFRVLESGEFYPYWFFIPLQIILSNTRDLIIILLAIYFVWGVTPFSKPKALINIPEQTIKQQVADIFESNEFQIQLKNSLPKFYGEDAKIWSVLNSMVFIADRNRRNFQKEYKKFFNWTIIVGILLSFIFLMMSYLFLYEASSGAEKSLVRLEKETNELQISLNNIENETTKEIIRENIQNINSLILTRKAMQDSPEGLLKAEINVEFNKISSDNFQEIINFSKYLNNKATTLDDGKYSVEFKNNLVEINQKIKNVINEREKTFTLLPILIEQTNGTIKEAKDNFSKPENRIPETIKRLFITLGVIAFFLGILKYLARIYRENFIQATIADQDHLLLKKFFITYKCAKTDDERKNILITFLASSNLSNLTKISDMNEEDSSAKMADLLKEISGVFKK